MIKPQQFKHVMVAGGRLALESDGDKNLVALPIFYMIAALSRAEQEILWRWSDAKQLTIGNTAVVFADGEPRGRYREFADTVTLEAYCKHECLAYQWIIRNSVTKMRNHAEIFARMMGEMVNVDFIGWGKFIANTDDLLIAYGASVGSTASLTWYLGEKYAAFDVYCTEREKRSREVLSAVRDHRALTGK